MTYLKIIVPAIILTGCSVGTNNYGHHGYNDSQNQGYSSPYAQPQPCHDITCSSPQPSYAPHYANETQSYGAQAPAYQPTYEPQSYYEPAYVPAQHPALHSYGTQLDHHDTERHDSYYNYEETPQLRGPQPMPRHSYTYGTIGGAMYDVDSDILGLQGRLGYQSANYIGAEIEAFTSLSNEDETIGTTRFQTGVDYGFGVFGLLRSNLSPRLSIHGRAGYHYTQLSVEETTGGVTVDTDRDAQDGFAYGIGTEYVLSKRDFIRADYTRYEQDFGANDSVSIAYGRKF